MTLRTFQAEILAKVVSTPGPLLVVAPTGAGKTVMMSDLASRVSGEQILIAHRQELVTQISLAARRAGLWHQVIAPQGVINHAVDRQIRNFGYSKHIIGAPLKIAGIDTLLRREIDLDQIRMWQIDEGHHVLPSNKWGQIVAQMSGVYGVGWTATPRRTDGKALNGVYKNLILGPTTREVAAMGYLTPIRVFAPPEAVLRSLLPVSKQTGEIVASGAAKLMEESHIVGDVVQEYQRLALGEPGLIFAINVDFAERHANAFRAAGISAEVVTYHTPAKQRDTALENLAAGKLQVIVNVDLFGEGTDIPEVAYVGCARPTESLSLWRQMCGRVMRLAPNKMYGLICDHVGNTLRHGMPDCDVVWSLEGRKKSQNAGSTIPVRTCLRCYFAFEGYLKTCPYCGYEPEIQAKSNDPKEVEGNLQEYSQELLDRLTKEANNAISLPSRGPRNPREAVMFKSMQSRRNAQLNLRTAISKWLDGRNDAALYRKFYHEYGIDVLSAQSLGGKDARMLESQIRSGRD